MEKYQAVCLDLDGTLLNDQKEVTSYNLEVLEKLYKEGITIIIATGRQYTVAKKLLQKFRFPLYIIYSNGAGIAYTKGDIGLCFRYLASDLVMKLLVLISEQKFSVMLNINDYNQEYDILCRKGMGSRYLFSYVERNDLSVADIDNLEEYKQCVFSLVVLGEKEDLMDLEQVLQRNFSKDCNFHITKNSRDVTMLEIMDIGADKAKALETLCIDLNLSIDSVVAFGDDMNDLGMLREVGCSVAMKNACEEVKSVAHMSTYTTNNHDGVGKKLVDLFKL